MGGSSQLLSKIWKLILIFGMVLVLILVGTIAAAIQGFVGVIGGVFGNSNEEAKSFDGKEGVLLGEFEITYYCTEKYPHICNAGPPYKTASGTDITPNQTIAVDPDIIPLDTWVVIDGQKYHAEDTGGAIKGYRIDIAVATHKEATAKGHEFKKVYRDYNINHAMTGYQLSNCGKDENGRYSGGVAGDSSGKEYHIIDWYSYPWNVVLRYENGVNEALVRQFIATYAIEAAENDNIGYDQSQRLTFWEQLKSVTSPAKITTPCEADCSSSTAAVIKKVGENMNIKELADISPSLTTYNMVESLTKVGFKAYYTSEYTSCANSLIAGDIVLNTEHHVAIFVSE